MSFDVLSSPWLSPIDNTLLGITPPATPAALTPNAPSTVPNPVTGGAANPWAPAPITEDLGLQALMRDWILQALTAAPLFAAASPLPFSGLPAGGGLGLESLATAYDYDNFAGASGGTPSYLLADGTVVTSKQLDLLI